ncbi:MAG: hypothetical protein A3G20_05870 [Acidobacteria bacterium RIFCSPLOWO2_12_FULL_59_11]|nr:MAG: hypothetical protein A3G20_05870 [Acidobacteria bacterium RIFCSPLOWO2_12_FULL_59_11]
MNKIEEAFKQLEADISELKACLPNGEWPLDAQNTYGSKKYRGIAKRIVLSAKRIQELVDENTFSR